MVDCVYYPPYNKNPDAGHACSDMSTTNKDNLDIIDEDDVSDKTDSDEPNIQEKSDMDKRNDDVEQDETEEEEDKEEDLDDPWHCLIQEAFEQCQSEFDERVTKQMTRVVDEDEARRRVYHNMLPAYRKALAYVFINKMLWFHAIRKDRIYLSVKNTVSNLRLLEDYDNDEAWKSAVNKRKFLFDRILKMYDPPQFPEPENDDDDDDDDDDDMRTEEQEKQRVNHVQRGGGSGGSSKLNVNLVSPSEQVALRAKDELLRTSRKRGFDGFTPEDSAEIEKMRKARSDWAQWTVI